MVRAASRSRSAAPRRRSLGLPLLPTTTIGCFPQTAEVRSARESLPQRQDRPRRSTRRSSTRRRRDVIRLQEEIGLDVLVHGEFERTDMVEYFAEQMEGIRVHGERLGAELRHALRAAAGDLRRRLAAAADDRAVEPLCPVAHSRPVKGMLTGPVTILKWSFVRDDQPRAADGLADRARAPRRGGRPGGGGHPHHPDRRAGLPRGAAAAPLATRRVSRVGGARLPPGLLGREARDADPHAHVLLRVQRHHRLDRRDGRRRHLDRELAERGELLRRLRRLQVPARDRAGRLRHPQRAGRSASTRWPICSGARNAACSTTCSGRTPTADSRRGADEEAIPSLRNLVDAARIVRAEWGR